MTISYDPTLVMISVLIAIAGTLTGLTVITGYNQSGRRNYASALIKAAIVIGGSIWSMHFVAMLAVRVPVFISYNLIETLFSLYIAITGTLFGLFVVSRRRLGAMSIPIGGLCMGAAIGGMHYLGMDAIRGCIVSFDPRGVVAAVGIAIVASSIALWFTFRKRGVTETLLGGFFLGAAIPSMHYTAMYATAFDYLEIKITYGEPLLSQDMLAFVITAATFIICGIFLLMFSAMAINSTENSANRG
jgi:NO-binding membrane sensor protein with MHYT domain